MPDVYWLEQTEEDVPLEDDWLSASEAACLGGMRFAKRRADWRLGRWTAKRALAVCLSVTGDPEFLARIEIRAAASGAPQVFWNNQPTAFNISLSHRAGMAMCALAGSNVLLGCDLEVVEARSDSFLSDYFTRKEREWIAQAAPVARSYLLTLLWSAKESALKALHVGLRLDTREVVVAVAKPFMREKSGAQWSPLQVRYKDEDLLEGWWQRSNNFIRTIVAVPAPWPPLLLEIPATAIAV
jgi:4'-phosphopantetheinyl transferase